VAGYPGDRSSQEWFPGPSTSSSFKLSFGLQGMKPSAAGRWKKVFQAILEELKPETAYFLPEGGERAGLFVVDMKKVITGRGNC